MISFVLLCFLPACVVSCLGTACMRRMAPRWGLMDQPAARKVHLIPTPLGGGIGIWLGVVLPLIAGLAVAWCVPYFPALRELLPRELWPHLDGVKFRSGQLWAILAGGTILSVMGLFDDWKSLPWQPRLGIQFLVACGLVYGAGIHASVFVSAPWIGSIATVLWIMVLINSFNFLDNMDGLSAGIGLISACLFGWIMLTATSEPRWLVGGCLLILAGSLLGFLVHNRPPAKIFMGDTGSYFIGLMLACLTVQGTFYEYHRTGTHVILAPLCILAVPLYDICSVILIRLWQGRSPFQPDKWHFSHRLVEMGLSKPAAVATIHLTTLMTGLAGLLLYEVNNWYAASLIGGLIVCLLAVIAILETAGRLARD
jgi:UDP-GlcNAc:undecaprenyl-phosphate GlcNAc-1-phosphate transferase